MRTHDHRSAIAWIPLVPLLLIGCNADERSRAPVPAARTSTATFVGGIACAGCHAEQYERWRGSHHDLAMQPATEATVLGDFSGAKVEHFGVVTRFFRRGDEFWVRTHGPQGTPEDFRIEYTFGVDPLQQYLIGFPDGRYQALTVAWDSRPRAAGGQRWFHLQPDEPVPHDDPLHWTGPWFNWNSRCAECHSTGLEKNYDEESDRYATRWAEIDVACEACHGAGSEHVRWAGTREAGERDARVADKGLLTPRLAAAGRWVRAPHEPTAHRVGDESVASDAQIDACGGCHSRRQTLIPPGRGQRLVSYHDAYSLALPVSPLYHADGQVRDEVFVLGSFLQSRMHAQGVQCSDCHDPHSLKLRAPGNTVCAQCHDPAVFDVRTHHHHDEGSEGAQCANCHMPETTYMVIDPRRDHSLRIPRPDLSVAHGTPNACTQCHEREGAKWAAERLAQWLRDSGKSLAPHFSERLASDDATGWMQLAQDATAPGIARAAALTHLGQQPGRAVNQLATRQLYDSDPMVRRAAASALATIEPARRLESLRPLLDDPVRSVRVEVARLLAPIDPSALAEEERAKLVALFAEYEAAQRVGADMPANQVNLGSFYLDRGESSRAENAYRRALRLDPRFIAAYLNLADLHRRKGREDEARQVLEQAVRIDPQAPSVHHALGLQRVRERAYDEALRHLARAHELAPHDVDLGYVYAVALFDTGSREDAIRVLRDLEAAHPDDARVLQALVDYLVRMDRPAAALPHAERLLRLHPADPRLTEWVSELRRSAGRR